MAEGRIHLLCIGINKYPNHPSGQLNFCKNDAELIFNSYSSYNCQTKKLIVDEEATKQNILIALSEISKDTREEDYIIFSFAGHGVSKNIDDANSENSYICPYEFKFDHPDITGISLRELKEKLGAINSKNKLLILDSCYSGGVLRREIEKTGFREINIREILELAPEGSGYGIITACDSNETAQESSELNQGIFTYYLIKSLKYDTEKYLEFDKIKNSLSKQIKEETKGKQNPQFKTDNEKFLIPVALTSETNENSKEIKLNLETLPTSSFEKVDKEDISKLYYYIQENKDVYISLTIEKQINKIYNELKNKIYSCLNSRDSKEVIECYNFCRERFLPIIEIFKNLAKFQRFTIINDNFSKIISILNISKGQGGSVAVLEIPISLIAELTFLIIGETNSTKLYELSFLFAPINYYGMFLKTPLIFNSKIWHPEIFYRDSKKFLEFLIKDISNLQEFGESLFIIDSISKKEDKFHSYPFYLHLDCDINNIICNLKNNQYKKNLEFFGLNKKEFLELAIKRYEEISGWRSEYFFDLFERGIIEELKRGLQNETKNN